MIVPSEAIEWKITTSETTIWFQFTIRSQVYKPRLKWHDKGKQAHHLYRTTNCKLQLQQRLLSQTAGVQSIG